MKTCYIVQLKLHFDALPKSLNDSTMSAKVKMMKEKVRVRSLTHNTSRVGGSCWSSRMGNRMSEKQVNYLHGLGQTKQVG
jgi:hypothetical protein